MKTYFQELLFIKNNSSGIQIFIRVSLVIYCLTNKVKTHVEISQAHGLQVDQDKVDCQSKICVQSNWISYFSLDINTCNFVF